MRPASDSILSAVERTDLHEDRLTEVADAERKLEAFLDAFTGTDIDAEAVQRSAAKRQRAVDEARDHLRIELARTASVPVMDNGAGVWEKLNAHEHNGLLRTLLGAVVVRPAGRGRKLPVADRCRVVVRGADVELPARNGHEGTGIVPIAFEDLDGEAVLGVAADEDQA